MRILPFIFLLMGIQSASAASVTYHVPSSALQPFGGGILPQFDPTFGTLTNVEYGLSGKITYAVSNLTKDVLDAYLVNFSIGLVLNGDGLTPRLAEAPFHLLFNFSDDGANTPLAPGTAHYLDFESADIIPDLDLAVFIGTGDLNVWVDKSEDSNVCYSILDEESPAASIACDRTPSDFMTSVTYEYDPVTAPGAIMLLLAGGLATAGVVRRKRGVSRAA